MAYARTKNAKGFASITEFPGLPDNGVGLIGFAGHRNSLLVATRTALDPSAVLGAGYPGVLEAVTDPVSGLSVINNLWVDQAGLSVNARIIVLYGVARGLPGAGHKFVSA